MAANIVSCPRRKTCDRGKNHPGSSNRKRAMEIKIWEHSPVLKSQQLGKIHDDIKAAEKMKTEIELDVLEQSTSKSVLEEETDKL